MGDVVVYLKNIKLIIIEVKLILVFLVEFIVFIKDGMISGKIVKEVCNLFYRRGFFVSLVCNSVGRFYLCVYNYVF